MGIILKTSAQCGTGQEMERSVASIPTPLLGKDQHGLGNYGRD